MEQRVDLLTCPARRTSCLPQTDRPSPAGNRACLDRTRPASPNAAAGFTTFKCPLLLTLTEREVTFRLQIGNLLICIWPWSGVGRPVMAGISPHVPNVARLAWRRCRRARRAAVLAAAIAPVIALMAGTQLTASATPAGPAAPAASARVAAPASAPQAARTSVT